MEICVLNPFFYPYAGGTERVLYEVYRRLSKRHNVTVISGAASNKSKEHIEEINGIRVIRLRTMHLSIPALPMPLPIMQGLPGAVQKACADIYHINNRYLYFYNTISAIKKANRALALTLHDAMPRNIDAITDHGGYLYDVVWGRRLMRYADVITAVSKDTLLSTVPKEYRERAYVIYNGVDTKAYRKRAQNNRGVERARKALGISADTVNIMNTGRLVAQKGQVYLLRAVADLAKRHKGLDLNLVIVGRGYLKDTLMYMAGDLGIPERVSILNDIPEREMPYYYNTASVFVSASLYEPASLAVMEALASGVPVVATRVGGVPEMMGGCGTYVRPKSVSGISKGIERALSNPKRAMRLANDGRKLMIKEHDWDAISREYEHRFEAVLRN
ncbi:MAG: glycosyltransferase family 4 protein [Candidatus Marsarchaeota archaeon]|jgi:glycosyltransferase involved in cell wall biosynthesis|nr:glycosyltransferase family 4 protein [Candidatus Marsarchaeota archaeon]MCL5111653.1 glycosyltransferase family 4 protein [Candidatus Marsarchaeota archaeon]